MSVFVVSSAVLGVSEAMLLSESSFKVVVEVVVEVVEDTVLEVVLLAFASFAAAAVAKTVVGLVNRNGATATPGDQSALQIRIHEHNDNEV